MRVVHLTKRFGGHTVLEDVTMEFPAGCVTCVMGASGRGKTTLLREMAAALSNGSETRPALRVGIVDERGELAGMYRGVPQLDVGFHSLLARATGNRVAMIVTEVLGNVEKRTLLDKMTSNVFAGFLTGLGITAIIQSSSATTVMVVGFVNSGLMTLRQAINVIMGANLSLIHI